MLFLHTTDQFWMCRCKRENIIPVVLSSCSRCGENKDIDYNRAIVQDVLESSWAGDFLDNGGLDQFLF